MWIHIQKFRVKYFRLLFVPTICAVVLDCAGGPDLSTPLKVKKIVSGHERCSTAQAGSPDCGSASNKLCRANAFMEGTTIDTQKEYCLDGQRLSDNCVFVTHAACQ
jgi:hypothetical protein